MKKLVEDFARYPYLQRLRDPDVLLGAMRDSVSSVTWRTETFGFAEAFDEVGGRYLGLRGGQVLAFGADAVGLLVRSSVANLQLEADRPKPQLQVPGSAKPLVVPIESTGGGKSSKSSSEGGSALLTFNLPTHFFSSVKVDAARISRDVGTIANEIIQHLASLPNSEIVVTVEIHARFRREFLSTLYAPFRRIAEH